MMLTSPLQLQCCGDYASSLVRASGYVSRVLDRVQKSTAGERPDRASLREWQEHRDSVLSQLFVLRGQIEKSQHLPMTPRSKTWK